MDIVKMLIFYIESDDKYQELEHLYKVEKRIGVPYLRSLVTNILGWIRVRTIFKKSKPFRLKNEMQVEHMKILIRNYEAFGDIFILLDNSLDFLDTLPRAEVLKIEEYVYENFNLKLRT